MLLAGLTETVLTREADAFAAPETSGARPRRRSPPCLPEAVDVVVPDGDSVTLSDNAASIEALTPAQIEALAGIGFTNLAATDKSLYFTVAQALAIKQAGLDVSVPAGDSANVLDNTANLSTLSSSRLPPETRGGNVPAVDQRRTAGC